MHTIFIQPVDPDPQLTLTIAAGSAAISLLAAIITFLQLRASERQNKHTATFEHLRDARKLQREASAYNFSAARDNAVAYYKGMVTEPDVKTQKYLELLDLWDLLGIAYKHRLVSRKIVLVSLRNTLRNQNVVSQVFIHQLRDACQVPTIYPGLHYLIGRCQYWTAREWLAWLADRPKALIATIRSFPGAFTVWVTSIRGGPDAAHRPYIENDRISPSAKARPTGGHSDRPVKTTGAASAQTPGVGGLNASAVAVTPSPALVSGPTELPLPETSNPPSMERIQMPGPIVEEQSSG